MAAALHMQPPAHRPSMDRTASFDQPRARSTPPFPSPYDPPSHIRNNSGSSNHSPYQQPFSGGYFPPPNQMYGSQSQPWPASAVQAPAFYSPPFQGYPSQPPVFHLGYQQHSQAEYSAWANAYQHMVMASVANGAHPGGMTPPPSTDYSAQERRRTNSGPSTQQHSQSSYFDQTVPQPQQHGPTPASAPSIPALTPPLQAHPKAQQPPQPYHPYKRQPSQQAQREQMPRSTSMPSTQEPKQGGMSRSPSVPSALDDKLSPAQVPPAQSQHKYESSIDSSMAPPPPIQSDRSRKSSSSDRSEKDVPSVRTASPAPKPPAARAATPLHPGPITNATNTPSTSRPSPLSQTATPEPTEKMVKGGGLKGRLRKALDKDVKKDQKSASPAKQPAAPAPASAPSFTSPSEASTRSATPPTTPPQDLPPPSAPFAYHHAAMASDVSLAETERTATISGDTKEKGKRSMFRMRNMSTDNISISSTVSSASMMIRKMGSIGKLARRNSLMNISKIFKDKPKDEDAALPEKEGKKKKDKKKKSKGEAAPATVSHAVAESDRTTEEEDRVLAGLSPAAKLARQHTLRSKAEAAKKDGKQTGEPTWDNNTATRKQDQLPSISSVASPISNSGPEVLHVQPRQTPTVVHAVAVTEQEYDSEEDSSDGETVEDLSTTMAQTRLSEEMDAEFQATWGNAYIDKNAVPKKGILKSVPSDSQVAMSETATRGPTLQHPSPRLENPAYDPFSPDFSPFDQPSTSESIYQNAPHNSSAPSLPLGATVTAKPPVPRSMTAPAAKRRLVWAPECAVYSTYDPATYDRRSEPATCNRLTPELAMAIKQELNALKLEMPVHPESRVYTQYFA